MQMMILILCLLQVAEGAPPVSSYTQLPRYNPVFTDTGEPRAQRRMNSRPASMRGLEKSGWFRPQKED